MSSSTASRERASRAAPQKVAGRRRAGDPPSLIAAAIPGALGILLVVLGWASVSGEAAFDDQAAGLNVAILGALVVLAGCGFYLYMFRLRLHGRVTGLRAETLGDDVADYRAEEGR